MTPKQHVHWLLPAFLCVPMLMGAEECSQANVGTKQVCEYGGKVYAPGDKFPSEDNCNTCSCTETGDVACTEKACVPGNATCSYNGSVYAEGDSFPSEDQCNTCSCMADGNVACTERGCAPGGGTCEHEGKYYAEGTTFTIGCAGCGCNAGEVVCDAIACASGCSMGDQSFAKNDSVVCADGCNECLCTDAGWIATEKFCAALPKLEKCEGPATNEVTAITPVYLEKNALALELGYGGGCEAHSFRLCTDGALAKSNPGQLKLWIVDDGEPDPCDAFITETHVFDLSSLDQILGAQATGKIVLRVGESSVPYAF